MTQSTNQPKNENDSKMPNSLTNVDGGFWGFATVFKVSHCSCPWLSSY